MALHDRIAIVDDDASSREGMLNLFRSIGLPTVAFASAEDFLESGCVDHTLCLVLDVQMPGMDGLSLQNYLAVTGYRIPIVFVSGYQDVAACNQALQSGAVGFLAKPFKEHDLLTSLLAAVIAGDAA
jgi:FixJ family two-component response regulator